MSNTLFEPGFRPMLAGEMSEDWSTLHYPVMASFKLDGIRCLTMNGVGYSRKLKPLPSKLLQALLSKLPSGLDGEIICPGGFNATQSAVMSVDGNSDFEFWVFDHFQNPHQPYVLRYRTLTRILSPCPKWVRVLHHPRVHNPLQLGVRESIAIQEGYEGLCIRSLEGHYKYGRSTTREGGLLKLKRFKDAEGEILDCVERLENHNVPTTDELGKIKRSSHKENMVPAGDLGAFICKFGDGVVRVGSGFTASQRQFYWQNRKSLIGSIVKYKYQPDPAAPGNAPRFPIFLGFRNDDE